MMEHKPCSIESSAAESHITPVFSAGGGGGGTMKRSPSELAFQEFYDNLIHQPQPHHDLSDTQIADDFLHFPHKSRPEMMNGLISDANYQHQGVSECESETLVWPQNAMLPADKQPNFNAPTLDSQSSICGNGSAASPTSAIDNPKIKRPGATATTASTVSSTEQSDDEAEAGPCEQSITVDLSDLKRIRRMVSNRESARRSRKRKQAHMAELQWQVDKLLGEKETLSNQYLDATQQYRQADTNNRVLKSDVEALKAKVRLAEDIVARGSLTSGLNQLLQSHLSTVPQPISGSHHHLHHHQLANVSPTISVLGDGGSTASYAGSGTGSTIGLANAEIKNGLISDAVSSVSDIWH